MLKIIFVDGGIGLCPGSSTSALMGVPCTSIPCVLLCRQPHNAIQVHNVMLFNERCARTSPVPPRCSCVPLLHPISCPRFHRGCCCRIYTHRHRRRACKYTHARTHARTHMQAHARARSQMHARWLADGYQMVYATTGTSVVGKKLFAVTTCRNVLSDACSHMHNHARQSRAQSRTHTHLHAYTPAHAALVHVDACLPPSLAVV